MSVIIIMLTSIMINALAMNVSTFNNRLHRKVELAKQQLIIELFNSTILESKQLLNDNEFYKPVLAACYSLRNIQFAEKVWYHATNHCSMKPTYSMYSKLLQVFQSNATFNPHTSLYTISNENFYKSQKLMTQWIAQYEKNENDRQLLAKQKGDNKYSYTYNWNNFIKIILLRTDWNFPARIKKVRSIVNFMINDLEIDPDHETLKLLLIDSMESAKVLFRAKSMRAQQDDEILQSFDTNIIQENVFLYNHVLIRSVLDACWRLKDFEFIRKVWNYVKSANCLEKLTHSLYSKVLNIYHLGNINITKENYQRAVGLTDEWIEQYKMDKESLKITNTNSSLFGGDILNQMMIIIAFKADFLSPAQKANTMISCFKLMIELDIEPNQQIFDIINHPHFAIAPLDCVQFIQEAKSINVAESIVNNLFLKRFPNKSSFEAFDEALTFKISSHIEKLKVDHECYT